MADIIDALLRAVTELQQRIGEIDRRIDSSVRHGKVTDVDTKKHLARIEIGESGGTPVKSAWVPYGQIAGDYKSHRPPTKGQQMTMFAPNGEVRQAVLLPMTWSDDNKSPSDKEDEHVTTYGKLKIVEKGDSYTLTVDNASFSMAKDKITFKVGDTELELTADGYTAMGGDGVFAASGNVYVGMDSKSDKTATRIMTESGPAKKAKAKV